MKHLFLLLGLLLAGGPAAAQDSRSLVSPDSVPLLATAPAPPDTVAAIHRLFAAKRLSLRVALPLTTAVLVGFVVATNQTNNGLDGLTNKVTEFFMISVVAGEVYALVRYNKSREAAIVAAFEQHHLPKLWRRELRPWHFKSTRTIP
jgi:hypothetical protein